MERKTPFVEGGSYHIFTRGVEKRAVFTSDSEYSRFLLLLFLCNGDKSVHIQNLLKKYQGDPSIRILADEIDKQKKTLVDILAYCLMPNHLHLVVREKTEGGISKFMLKLMTAYSMFFNTKHERSGPLFTRPFRSKYIDSDDYFQWVFAYVHLNPLELFDSHWKERGVLKDAFAAAVFMRSYKHSSFHDYFVGERPESCILAKKETLPFEIKELKTMDDLCVTLASKDALEFKGFS